MSIHVALNHVSHYRYDRPVTLGPQLVRLRPAPHCRTRILSYSLRVRPAQHFINWQQDPQANYLARLVFPERSEEFRVEVDLIAEMAVLNPFDFFLTPYAETTPFEYEAAELSELAPYLLRSEATPVFAEYLARIPRSKMRTIDFLVELNQRIAHDIRYLIRMEAGVQTPEVTLSRAAGSCRDSGWLLVQLLRHLGLAARFVSGYLIQLKSDVKALEGPSGPEHDFTDLHAWCEVYLPGAGWIGLDPTSGLMAGEGHIPLACTPEPSAAAPVSGEVDQSEVQFEHLMTVVRIWEAPRVTKPYTEAQWAAIGRLGALIDVELERGDVRLTMGGEPTFVSIDEPDGAEWNTTALGPNKRKLAAQLYHRLREHYAPHGLVHFGQGKWYPGEQLPRWSLNCYWRRDGEPIWRTPGLIADENRDDGVTAAMAQKFLQSLAERLGLDPRHVFAGFEDVFYYLWRERRLPINVDPLDSRLDDPQERARLMRVFSQGLERIAGHALPIARDKTGAHWQSGRWFMREDRCYLIPGDSPMGYRLPLDSQPWVTRSDYPYVHAPDPMQSHAPLPRYAQVHQQPRPGAVSAALVNRLPAPHESAPWITRSAMCAEPRNGVLHVFMPPLERAADYLQLVAAVEATAAALKQPVLLEGYEPPRDPGLNSFRITPDPGVIEANIHPAHDWAEMVERTTFLYEAARELRLGTEKFMLDGRHTGTGGGNHFVLGGATALDSPFLRRPDLLASLLAYWHNHPSLSYLFSGLFVGPTSQAPRVDEARNDSLYELELAFQQLPAPGSEVPPWLTDRVLRNLLIDVTGNTHRAEFCIDKLYSPDGPNGRLGLVELRAFEMPPHHRMSLTQQLLLRSLVARFWRQPYRPARLARWGTELHDRFMLPHFVEQDFRDVLQEQQAA
ncbi:MAG TPA: transglutaminase family protein, partial [Steroidobacteraceae bacterium]|nr:transglutaminase family protein [Steroidobacteraceae bacterium]